MEELSGTNAIVTGVSRGIGVHIARALARRGVNLALAARSVDALEEVRDEVESLGVDAVAIPTDLARPAQVQRLAEKAQRQLGAPDILINNAGVEITAPYESQPTAGIETAVKVNLLGAMLLTRAVLPEMLEQGRGHIVNISSLAGQIGLPYLTPYAATKAGLNMFTHSLRAELIDKPVGASVICPGFIADAGMYSRKDKPDGNAPTAMTPTTRNKVVDAVIKAIDKDKAQLTVNPLPVRPLTILREVFTGITPRLHKTLGTTGFARQIAEVTSDEQDEN